MPAFRDRLTDKQAADLVAHIRAFAPKEERARPIARPVSPGPPAPDLLAQPVNVGTPAVTPRSFEAEFRKLEKEFDATRRQLRELTAPPRPPAAPAGRPAGQGRRRRLENWLARRHPPGRPSSYGAMFTGPRVGSSPAPAVRGWPRR
jgi:hypothetical protein